jgi:hypothetical protein
MIVGYKTSLSTEEVVFGFHSVVEDVGEVRLKQCGTIPRLDGPLPLHQPRRARIIMMMTELFNQSRPPICLLDSIPFSSS